MVALVVVLIVLLLVVPVVFAVLGGIFRTAGAVAKTHNIMRDVDAQIAHLSDEEKTRFLLAFAGEIDDRPGDEQPDLVKRAYAYGRGEIEHEDIFEGLEKPDPIAIARGLKL